MIGGGPAGLMAAEVVAAAGASVQLFERMPTVGRKFLLAGRGGLNLTHSEPLEAVLERFPERRAELEPALRALPPEAVRGWARELGIETFVGTSGRVFPVGMKAAPLLRAWIGRLRGLGVLFHLRHRWLGWDDQGALRFEGPEGSRAVHPRATVLALGGASWPRLGSDGAWVPGLRARGVGVRPLEPANCGYEVAWSARFIERFAGSPVKSVAATVRSPGAAPARREGEFVITSRGVEGSLIYPFVPALRRQLSEAGVGWLELDLAPGRSLPRLIEELSRPRGGRSWSEHLRRRAGIEGVKAGLLRELCPAAWGGGPAEAAAALKALPLGVQGPRPIEEAISAAGGVGFGSLGPDLELESCPGVFCAGEMLDWEAPTGGYLLTACLATGRQAGAGALAWLRRGPHRDPHGGGAEERRSHQA